MCLQLFTAAVALITAARSSVSDDEVDVDVAVDLCILGRMRCADDVDPLGLPGGGLLLLINITRELDEPTTELLTRLILLAE